MNRRSAVFALVVGWSAAHAIGLASGAATNEAVETPASTTNKLEVPLLDARIEACRPFDPIDPKVDVVYTNLSRTHGIVVQTPYGESERRLVTVGLRIDGEWARHLNEDAEDVCVQASAVVEPNSTLAVRYRLADCYRIPTNWSTIAVDKSHGHEVALREYTFDRKGVLAKVDILKEADTNELRQRILGTERGKRWLEMMRRRE